MSKRVLVIGYGNPLRGDDGLGWEVAGRLAACVADPDVAIVTVPQLTPELADAMREVDLVIFVDAASEGKPGAWRCEDVGPASAHAPALGHRAGAADLLAYTQVLYGACPRALVVSITAASFECHEDLSREVEAALPAVVWHIREQIALLNSDRAALCA